MHADAPSSRAPRGLRGPALTAALRELGYDADEEGARTPRPSTSPHAGTRDTQGASAGGASCAAEPPEPEASESSDSPDDDDAPAALRPEQLARWLQRRG
jgi:hypothetical protein